MIKTPRHLGMMLIGAATAASGCITNPDALRMHVTPTQMVFAQETHIRLRVTLSAHGGPVCYGRRSHFALSLDGDGDPERCETHPIFVCGTGMVVMLPWYILITPVIVLDVADVGGRFTVIPDGQEMTYLLAVVKSDSALQVRNLDEPKSPIAFLTKNKLSPGRYRARVELIEEHDFPAPLFWAPYDKPVVAETEFRIEAETKTTSG